MSDRTNAVPGDEEPGLAPDDGSDAARDGAPRAPAELIMAMSPRQILGGFALMAALIVVLRRRIRGRD